MRDRRLKALLESEKTISRKARSTSTSRQASALPTPTLSPAASRAPSVYAGSEADDLSDRDVDASMPLPDEDDDVLASEHVTTDADLFHVSFVDRLTRRGIYSQERQKELAIYVYRMGRNYIPYDPSKVTEELAGLARLAKMGRAAEERSLALQFMAILLLTQPADDAFSSVRAVLRDIAHDDDDDQVKHSALLTLGIAAVVGGASSHAAHDVLRFFLDVVATDGAEVDSHDSETVVVAALKAWAFVASQVEDLQDIANQALDAFVDQLESSSVDVQTATAANIALVFEASRDYEAENGVAFDLQRSASDVVQRMMALSKQSVKAVAKRNRRTRKGNLASVITSLERGTGPNYSEAGRPGANPHTGDRADGAAGDDIVRSFHEFGYRDKFMVGDEVVVIDSWCLAARVDMLRTVLKEGFTQHLASNETVSELIR